jgi:hypothetical protein
MNMYVCMYSHTVLLCGCGTWFVILIEEDKLRYYSTAEYLDLRRGKQTMCIKLEFG